MALFKIFKGSKDNLGQAPGTGLQDTRQTHEGFAYFTPEDGKFYIDIADSNSAVVGTNRIPISADKADKDASGNIITSTYLTKATGVTNVAWNSTNKKLTKTINGSTTDIVTIGTIKTALALDKSDVGLGNVANIDQSKAIKSITSSGTTFTYTCLDDTTGTFTQQDNNTATAVDNILDGSNSGTAITYAPYTSQQSKLSFDTSAAFPTRTDRLNLNGALYATKFQAEHLKNDAGEYRVTYGDTINMWLGVGNGNTNHGLYDSIAGKWMIVADSSGNVTVNGTASAFSSAAAVTLTGDVTGTASSTKGWSIATTIGNGKVTNAMLAGSIVNGKLTNSKVTIAGNDVSLGGSLDADILRSSLGLSSAMHFIGVTTTEIEDGDGSKDSYAGISGYTSETPGDVILYDDAEFVWTGSYWELLGDKGSFKIKQTAITNSTGTADDNNTSTSFIYSISQNANGEISAKSRKLPTASTSTAGIMTTDMVTKLSGIQESADAVSFTRSLTSGTKVGTITINGTGTDIYAPTNTDTKNTAGSTDTSSKIFLIGATEQSANPQTYSDDQVFTTSGVLTAKELVLSTTGARSITFSRTDGYNYIQTPAGGGVAICATDNSVSLVGSTLLVNATNVKPGQTNTYDLGTSSNKWKAAYVTTLNSDDIIVDNLTASQAVSTDANKKLVSTNLTVSDPTASGTGITYIATISQNAVGKIIVTKSTVRSASTSQTGVVQLSSATNSTSETLAATAKAVKTAYDLANTANTTANSHKYWANIESTSAAAYNKTPEVASIKINGDTSASVASTKNVQLTYDSADDSINFNFI